MDVKKLIAPAEAAEKLGVKEQTLAVWRCTGRYDIPYIKIGSKVMYRLSHIESFINSNEMEGLRDGQA